jgi:hypothetical protein
MKGKTKVKGKRGQIQGGKRESKLQPKAREGEGGKSEVQPEKLVQTTRNV